MAVYKIREIQTGLKFRVEHSDNSISAHNSSLDLSYIYEYRDYDNNDTKYIDWENVVLEFSCLYDMYDMLSITGIYEHNKEKFNLLLKLENSAIPYFINESVDNLYYDLATTKIEAYIKEKEQQALIDALNAELLSLRSNLSK